MKNKETHWREQAVCRGVDSEVFFPSKRGTGEERWDDARAICAFCPVRKQCLTLALGIEEHDDRWGMFGGKSPIERRALRHKQMVVM